MSSDIHKNNITVILIQIDEAHSTAWPMSIEKTFDVDEVEPQRTFKDRIDRANHFVNKYNPPYPVYIDTWSNDFSELFRAWPDKYHCINNKLQIIAKSEYNRDVDKEATIVEDCTIVLEKLIKNKNL